MLSDYFGIKLVISNRCIWKIFQVFENSHTLEQPVSQRESVDGN